MNDSAIIYDEAIYAEEQNFNEKNATCEAHNFYVKCIFC